MTAAELTPPDLVEEYEMALRAYLPQQIAAGKRLRHIGVRMTAYLPPFGLARVEQLSSRRYAPIAYDWEAGDVPPKGKDSSLQALIIPLLAEDGETLLDLLAFYGAEGHYLRRTGIGGALDLPYADAALYDGALLQLTASPLAWLRRGGRALCVLDWQDEDVNHLLRWSRGIHVGDDLDLADTVYKHVRKPLKRAIPEVVVDGAAARGRAA